jgi:protease-4
MKKIVRYVFRFFLFSLALVGLAVVLLMLGLIQLASKREPLADQQVLTLDLAGPLRAEGDVGLESLFSTAPSLADIVTGLDAAAGDDRVKGLLLRFGPTEMGLADAQELRRAVTRFRESGKFAIAYADSFGELGPGNAQYYLAAACGEVLLQPIGGLGLTGIGVQEPFAREALERLGAVPDVMRRGEFKTAADNITDTVMSETHRTMMQGLVDDLTEQMLTDIAADRNIPAESLPGIVDRAPLTGPEALSAKLIDRISYRDEAEMLALRLAAGYSENDPDKSRETLEKEGVGLVSMSAYRSRELPEIEARAALPVNGVTLPRIGLIQAEGAIMRQTGETLPMGGPGMDIPTVVKALEDAAKDESIAAIVLRIDSGGGSAVASETLRRAVAVAAEAKPVVVSMGNMAASGGYWMALDATALLAEPATLTGSIGVIAGKINLGPLSDRLGVHWESLDTGDNALIWSPVAPFSDSQRARVNVVLDDIYGGFLTRVSEARNLPPETVKALAGGRVWTGRQAVELGLVDRLGGIREAADLARDKAGLGEGAAYALVRLPEGDSPALRMLRRLTGAQAEARLPAVLEAAAPLLGEALAAPGDRVAAAPGFTVR